jgi:hypothetical protein
MKKVVKLKESDLIRIVKRVINESDQNIRYGKVINGRAVWDDDMDGMDMDDMDMDGMDMDDEMPY